MLRPIVLSLSLLLASAGSAPAAAADLPSVTVIIRNHGFTPDKVTIPAGRKVVLVVHNQDLTPEEFESNEFNREKLILGGQTARIYVGPLKAGHYRFFGEFHADTAQGVLVAEE